MVHCGQSLGKSADVFAVMYVSTPCPGVVERRRILLIRLDLPATLPHTASTGRIEPVFAGLTNHNLCDIFHTLTEMFVYKFLLGFYKIWDIIFYFILLGCTFAETG